MNGSGLLSSGADISAEGVTDLIYIRICKYISLLFLEEGKEKVLAYCIKSFQ